MPVYNTEHYLPNCIDSILNQTFTDFELILVNDGSSDNSCDIIKRYQELDNRVKAINKSNAGVSSARNEGIRFAEGDFITFIDSDDCIRPSYLANFRYDREIDYEIQGMRLVYEQSDKPSQSVVQSSTRMANYCEIIEETELNRTSRGPCLKLFKSEIIKRNKILFDETLSYGEDSVFVKTYLLHCSGKGLLIRQTDYDYIHRPNSNSLTNKVHKFDKRIKAINLDLRLFGGLESIFGPFSSALTGYFKYERVLETFAAYCDLIRDKRIDKEYKIECVKSVKQLILDISFDGALPIFYRSLYFSLYNLNDRISTTVNSGLINILDIIKR